MRTEIRFLLAVVLMIAVLVVTNIVFPPIPPEERPGYQAPDSVTTVQPAETENRESPVQDTQEFLIPNQVTHDPLAEEGPEAGVGSGTGLQVAGAAGGMVLVKGPLYEYAFSSQGGRLLSVVLPNFSSFTIEGAVELIRPEGPGALGARLLVGTDTLDLRALEFQVEPAQGLILSEGGGPQELRFSYQHPTHPFHFEVTYTFQPDLYAVQVSGRVEGVDAAVVYTELGSGIPFNEQQEKDEERVAAYVLNHPQEGIRSQRLVKVDAVQIEEGPFFWTAFKSKYFVIALLAGSSEEEEAYLGGVIARDGEGEFEAHLTAAQSVRGDGSFSYRLFMGPQEFDRLTSLGQGMQNVNPYGWGFVRPIVRPIVGIIMKILSFFHENLNLGYGWVLILFGLLMRIVLFPLNQKAMRSQIKNMAVQPLIAEIQAKYKDNPEKLQKETMKLYKDHGFNPLGGCLPMLLPFPVLIALFFVFQNTIELRGVPFLWLPDLSAPDPYFILPVFLGLSMFLLQWVSMKSMTQTNQQMKMMMYFMPIMMVFIFFQLASGLNLYYSVANIATLPQQLWIAGERKKAQAKGPLTLGGKKS
jgi:YidC/Oxa1 family membrane protein insertase